MTERRTALVTGGNRGIGLETCRRLASAGLRVVLAARRWNDGEVAAREVPGEVRVESLDVGDPRSVEQCAGRLRETGWRVDVLVNNAGVYPEGTALSALPESWSEALEVNLLGAVRTCRAFVPAMVAAGWGRVVNVSSGYGSFGEGLEGPAPYSVSKAALDAFTVKLAREVGPAVKVNAVCPGWVRTRMGGPSADRSVEEGAAGVVRLALLPDDGPAGGFFRDAHEVPW